MDDRGHIPALTAFEPISDDGVGQFAAPPPTDHSVRSEEHAGPSRRSGSTGTPPRRRVRDAGATASGWQVDHRGEPIPNLTNALHLLRSSSTVGDVFAHDGMLMATVVTREPPGPDGMPGKVCAPRPATDADIGRVQEFMQRNGLPRIGSVVAHQAADLHALERSFHPVKDYLDALQWDGTPRVQGWLATYLGAESTPYTDGIGTMFLVSMIARINKPGCKADYMMVLEGEQGSRKSTACSILGGSWFSDSLPDLTVGKDVSQHLPGKWLIEIGEMAAMNRAENNALKAFITRPVEEYRPSYGRKQVHEPRQCVFIGTTNKSKYLRDETGGRRFWPVKISKIQTDKLISDRDQLFAEAVKMYRDGARWWPDDVFEAMHIAPEQSARYEDDIWEESVRNYLEHRHSVLVGDIAREALFFETARICRADQNRITGIMERLNWSRGKKDSKGNIPWVRPGAP